MYKNSQVNAKNKRIMNGEQISKHNATIIKAVRYQLSNRQKLNRKETLNNIPTERIPNQCRYNSIQ